MSAWQDTNALDCGFQLLARLVLLVVLQGVRRMHIELDKWVALSILVARPELAPPMPHTHTYATQSVSAKMASFHLCIL
jgi:hypothetical protein